MKKYTFLLISQLLVMPVFAQSTVYKCTDNDGNISYTTEKTSNCEKTNLGTVDKSNTLNKLTNLSSLKPNNPIDKVVSEEQKAREQKRAIILQNELTQEKNELKTVTDMLKKIEKSGDEQQIAQLKSMEELHKKNIAALQKELGLGIEMVTPPIANIPKGLPVQLPSEEVQQELIASVAPKKTSEIKKNLTINNNIPTKTTKIISSQNEVGDKNKVIELQPALITNTSLKKKYTPLDFTQQTSKTN